MQNDERSMRFSNARVSQLFAMKRLALEFLIYVLEFVSELLHHFPPSALKPRERCLYRAALRELGIGKNSKKRQASRPISSGQLSALLHLHTHPINPVVFRGTLWGLNVPGEVVLKRVSHLDAFSGYLVRT